MKRLLERELTLNEAEVIEAIKWWLVNAHDIQIGKSPLVSFAEPFHECLITSREEETIRLEASRDVRLDDTKTK